MSVMNRTMRRLDAAAQDLRFAARQLRRRPAFTAIALLVIAAGIGVNAATLSFLSAVYARTLPVPEAGRLVAIHGVDARTARAVRLEPAHVAHVRAHASGFSGLAAQDWAWTWLSEGDRSVEWRCGLVSEEYFDLLRVTPFLGRFFAEGDDEVGPGPLARRLDPDLRRRSACAGTRPSAEPAVRDRDRRGAAGFRWRPCRRWA